MVGRLGLLGSIVSYARLAVRLLREPRVSLLAKALPIGAGLYLVSPLDILPDVLPLLGQIDDLVVILIALQVFVHLCPAPVVTFHRHAIAEGRRFSPMPGTRDVIDAEWRREE